MSRDSSMSNFQLDNVREFLNGVSTSNGVYVMKGEGGTHLYIGKANNLRNRLRSYFRPSGLSHRIETVMRQTVEIETIVTSSETEALLLENNLIKSCKPRYNINLRDDKSYPYIRLDDSHEFPKLGFYRGSKKEPGRYFGPFSSAAAVRETLSQLQKIFPVRQCRDSFFRYRSRPCLQYQIQRCTAPCVGLIDREAYMEDVEQVVDFLMGKNQKLNNMLMKRMDEASANLDFESAIRYRDRISAIQRLRESQTVDSGNADSDVIAVVLEEGIVCIQMVIFRSGRNVDYRTYFPKLKVKVEPTEILAEFIPQYYLSREAPALILVDRVFEQSDLVIEALSQQNGRRISVHRPQRGSKVKLLEMARINARDAIRRRVNEKESMQQRLAALVEVLKLDEVPTRIECFDISHTSGERTVASCVVFDQNGPLKTDYRKMNISDVPASDDYAAIRQALTRRYRRLRDSEGMLPDLVLVDGGRGQLQVAAEVMDELQIADIRIAAISKGRERKAGKEQIWIPETTGPIKMNDLALLLLQQIRDEAHRFALIGHRGRRNKARKRSTLEDIPGIGNRKRSMLLKHFGGWQGIARAGIEELQQVSGISPKLAERIHFEFHGKQM